MLAGRGKPLGSDTVTRSSPLCICANAGRDATPNMHNSTHNNFRYPMGVSTRRSFLTVLASAPIALRAANKRIPVGLDLELGLGGLAGQRVHHPDIAVA